MDNINFRKAFLALLGNEGNYVNHPEDPGGETKFLDLSIILF